MCLHMFYIRFPCSESPRRIQASILYPEKLNLIEVPYIYPMPNDNNRPLKEWLQVFAQSPQLRARLYQTRVEKMWAEMMGPVVSGYTRKIRLDERTLILYIDSASLKMELSIMKEKILEQVNERLGETYIQEVKIL